jgi:putative transcriptional regulator
MDPMRTRDPGRYFEELRGRQAWAIGCAATQPRPGSRPECVDKAIDGRDDRAMDESSSVLAPSLLVAMPQLRDPNFFRSVVLLCEHGPGGAMGFVVNRPTDTRAADAVAMDPPLTGDSGMRLWTGGPVEQHRGFLLLGSNPGRGDSEQITDGFHLTASLAVLRDLLETTPERLEHTRARLLLGYAGWGPGQLDSELAESAWLLAPADPRLVFDTPPDHMWEVAIRSLGIDPMSLAPAPGIQ